MTDATQAELERLKKFEDEVRRIEAMRPGARADYVDGPRGDGAHMAHGWWKTVIGGALRDLDWARRTSPNIDPDRSES